MKNYLLIKLRQIYSFLNRYKIVIDLKEFLFLKYLFLKSLFYKSKFNPKMGLRGVNFLGLIRAEIGLGQSSRLIINSLEKSGIEYTLTDFEFIDFVGRNDLTWAHKITNDAPYNINLIHLNAPELILAHLFYDKSKWKNKYNIGFWLWELEEFPKEWLPALKFLDEIWTPSSFITNALKKYTNKPIRTISYPIHVDTNQLMNRKYFELEEDSFTFITLFDFNSSLERKNPFAVIEAFKQAFKDNENVTLILKINNPKADELLNLQNLILEYPNIKIINKTLSRIEVNSLINVSDVLVSLHRAEGFGLTLAEAMYLGKPTIATNWSANTEFMNPENSCLVNYDLIEIQTTFQFYKKGFHWADPHLEEAVYYMKRLFNDRTYYHRIGSAAQDYMRKNYTLVESSINIKKRIEEIYKSISEN